MRDYVNAKWDESVQQRVWKRVARPHCPDGCWIWQGTVTPKGYGRIRIGKGFFYVHRLMKAKAEGAMPHDKHCDHLCRNPRCVNPSHIELVSPKINTARGLSATVTSQRHADRTHCKRGHEFTPENTRQAANGRACRECQRSYNRAFKAKRRLLKVECVR